MTRELNAKELPAIRVPYEGITGPSLEGLGEDGAPWPISGDRLATARARAIEDEAADRRGLGTLSRGIGPRVYLSDIVDFSDNSVDREGNQ